MINGNQSDPIPKFTHKLGPQDLFWGVLRKNTSEFNLPQFPFVTVRKLNIHFSFGNKYSEISGTQKKAVIYFFVDRYKSNKQTQTLSPCTLSWGGGRYSVHYFEKTLLYLNSFSGSTACTETKYNVEKGFRQVLFCKRKTKFPNSGGTATRILSLVYIKILFSLEYPPLSRQRMICIYQLYIFISRLRLKSYQHTHSVKL